MLVLALQESNWVAEDKSGSSEDHQKQPDDYQSGLPKLSRRNPKMIQRPTTITENHPKCLFWY